MWSMGKVLKTPEVLRVFIGSFWDQPMAFTDNAELFEAEENDLLTELRNLPQNAAIRKINEFVKRARLAKVHCFLIGVLREKMPAMIGKEKKQKALIETLGETFREVQRRYHLPPGDFPQLDEFQKKLADRKFHKFASLNVKGIQEIDDLLSKDIPKLMASLPKKDDGKVVEGHASFSTTNPFASAESIWDIEPFKDEFDAVFQGLQLDSQTNRASGSVCMAPLQATGCPPQALKTIWELADMDKDGYLDQEEFAIAMYLCNRAKEGDTMPTELSVSMIPPSKRSASTVDS
uniref:Uncharacterized protein AlNc14C147G7412 n=1 Tax=Albugo laibachii Nc14 TaxID=890382 RepID=F0WLM3_9STRA|nr:conserved hypothetical protein [Albugo laibachii Nc14]|eukprot:CCA22189.1 conserved hypothetical protein [Albugo laibachii Nc14]